ncbi:MAG: hypothetical protein U9N46_10850, partial [Euryarchaeota archaeon]|nr:hypothetical protein [Euryarchaeota archaeon]
DDVYSAILHRFFPDQYEPGWLIDVCVCVCVWDIRLPRIYAVPLIHGPAGCASPRQMDPFDVLGLVPLAPCKNLSEIDLDSVAIHHEYVDFHGIGFDYREHGVFVYPPLRGVDGDNIIGK